jgi:hypothetical protein
MKYDFYILIVENNTLSKADLDYMLENVTGLIELDVLGDNFYRLFSYIEETIREYLDEKNIKYHLEKQPRPTTDEVLDNANKRGYITYYDTLIIESNQRE